MVKYVALLRGIAPLNPQMRNQKLRDLFEDLGFTNVQTVIASGNVLFESPKTNSAALESLIEAALPERLGFNSTTIIRSQRQLQQLMAAQPFAGHQHSQKTYLTVTFLKHDPPAGFTLAGPGYRIVSVLGRHVCCITNITASKTPDLMAKLEQRLGKHITTRTSKTVERILAKFG